MTSARDAGRIRLVGARARGQSTVEFAVIVPLVVVAVLGAIQVGMFVLAQLSVTHTAREVARVISIDATADIELVIAEVAPLASPDIAVEIEWRPAPIPDARLVVVRVEDRVPLVTGSWPSDLVVSATVVTLSET